MRLTSDDRSRLRELKDHLKSYNNANVRLVKFDMMYRRSVRDHSRDRILFKYLLNCKSLFPSVENKKLLLNFALHDSDIERIKLLEESNFNVHEFTHKDGMSAVHFLAELMWRRATYFGQRQSLLKLMEYFLKNARKNYRDGQGYTYLHAACVTGNTTLVSKLLRRGVDVNLDSCKYSALHVAAWYRHEDVVEFLLKRGANPNQPDVELQSTPLHSLSWVCLCECASFKSLYCDKRKPCEKIVRVLVEAGANIEARNRRGDTALQMSVSRFDVDLTRALLKHGASLSSLNEDRMFRWKFKAIELKSYPLTLNMIEMLQLLESAGYKIDLLTRLRMIKCWMRVRGDDTDHLLMEHDIRGATLPRGMQIDAIMSGLYIHREFNFYIEQEAEDFLDKKSKSIIPGQPTYIHEPTEYMMSIYASDVARTKEIMLTEDVSLHQVCQMNYSRGYSTLKKMKYWSLPPMDSISCTHVNIIAKRHLAKIFIRPHLELFAADLFMADYCKLDLPYTVCRGIAEHMSDKDILRLCELTTEKSLVLRLPTRRSKRLHLKRQHKNEDGSRSSPIRDRKRLQRQ